MLGAKNNTHIHTQYYAIKAIVEFAAMPNYLTSLEKENLLYH